MRAKWHLLNVVRPQTPKVYNFQGSKTQSMPVAVIRVTDVIDVADNSDNIDF